MSFARQALVLVACMGVTFVLGSVHAFSVLVEPLETLLDVSRSRVSLVYALALVSVTVTVLLGYRIYPLLPPPLLVGLACLLAAMGLLASTLSTSWIVWVAGYSIVFGAANGVGYGYTLQLSARVMPERAGLAMSWVTAAYAIGSVVFSLVLSWLLEVRSIEFALRVLALMIALCGVCCGIVLLICAAKYQVSVKPGAPGKLPQGSIMRTWLAYFLAVFSGLMVIGHAAEIAAVHSGNRQIAVAGAMMVGFGSAAGGALTGLLLDKWRPALFVIGLPVLAGTVLLVLMLTRNPLLMLPALSLVGFSYGAIIAVYPYLINQEQGDSAGVRVYGRVFTAWGVSGLLAPWFAGLIYDSSGNYSLAIGAAALAAFASALVARNRGN